MFLIINKARLGEKLNCGLEATLLRNFSSFFATLPTKGLRDDSIAVKNDFQNTDEWCNYLFF